MDETVEKDAAGFRKARSLRRWVQLSLSGLLFLVLCACGFLLGFRVGYDRGYRAEKWDLQVTKVVGERDAALQNWKQLHSIYERGGKVAPAGESRARALYFQQRETLQKLTNKARWQDGLRPSLPW